MLIIGSRTYTHPTATLADCVTIGKDCYIGPGVRIGDAGFGYYELESGMWDEKPHYFGVVIGDNVHIKANTCIDRGSWRDTVIGSGTKIDNLVHVAHNVHIGQNVLIVAHAMIAGSVTVGDGAWIGPSSSILQRLHVAKRGFVGAGAVVTKDVPENTVVAGVPARVIRERRKSDA